MTGKQRLGFAIVLVSLLTGGVGALWNLYSGYAALQSSELTGLGPVTGSFRTAFMFALGGVIGAALGAALMIFGRSKSTAGPRMGSDL